jgi:hypothetical protein
LSAVIFVAQMILNDLAGRKWMPDGNLDFGPNDIEGMNALYPNHGKFWKFSQDTAGCIGI